MKTSIHINSSAGKISVIHLYLHIEIADTLFDPEIAFVTPMIVLKLNWSKPLGYFLH